QPVRWLGRVRPLRPVDVRGLHGAGREAVPGVRLRHDPARGAAACPGARAPAPALEDVVVSRLRALGRDPALRRRAAAELEASGAAEHGAETDVPDFLRALVDFEPVWNALFPAERGRMPRLLVDRVVYDPDG